VRLYLGLFVLGIGIFLVHYRIAGQAVYGDGIGYYAHLHSWIIDKDWEYSNEYKHNYSPLNNNSYNPTQADSIQIVATNSRGQAENHYSPGTAVLLLPAYLLAHFLSNTFHFPNTGYSDLYQILVGISAVGFTIAGLFVLDKLIRLFVDNKLIARITVISIFLGTHLIYYGSFDVVNSHFASFFLTCIFMYLLFTTKPSVRNDLILGGLVGLMSSVRLQDGVAAVIWLIYRPRYWVAFGSAFAFSLISMFYQWSRVFDTIWQHRYLINFMKETTNRVPIDFFGSWFDSMTGLFSRSPVLMLGIIGLVSKKFRIHDKRVWVLILFIVIQTTIIVVQRGWSASAYGGRMYTSCLVPFAVLIGLFFQKLKIIQVKILSGIFIILSLISVFHFVLLEKPTQDGGRGTESKTWERLLNL
jgi:hypothetical protein